MKRIEFFVGQFIVKSSFLFLLFFQFLFCTEMPAQTQDAVIKASLFCESFDAVSDIGGNDSIISGDGQTGFPIIYDNQNNSNVTIKNSGGHYYAGAECVRLKGESNNSAYLNFSFKSFPEISSGNGEIHFRSRPWNNETKYNIYVKVNSSEKKVELNSSDMKDYSVSFSNSNVSSVTFTVKSSHYVFLDEVTIFVPVPNSSDYISTARKLILSGTFSEEDVNAMNSQLQNNNNIVSIDAKDATFPSGTELKVGNPNALIYLSNANAITNKNNVVANEMCENLVLCDGDDTKSYPFYSACTFTAKNVSYDRTFNVGTYCSTYLPFPVCKSMHLSYLSRWNSYDMDSKSEDFGTLYFVETDNVAPNEPCIIAASVPQPFKDMQNVNLKIFHSSTFRNPNTNQPKRIAYPLIRQTFRGVYSLYNLSSTINVYRYGFSQGVIKKVNNEGGFFKPFRALMTFLAGNVPTQNTSNISLKYVSISADLSQITQIKNEVKSEEIWDLNGRKYPSIPNQKGIYIINGKKVYVK